MIYNPLSILTKIQIPVPMPKKQEVNRYDQKFTIEFPEECVVLKAKETHISLETKANVSCGEAKLYSGSVTISIDPLKDPAPPLENFGAFVGAKLIDVVKSYLEDLFSKKKLVGILESAPIPHPHKIDRFCEGFISSRSVFQGHSQANDELVGTLFEHMDKSYPVGEFVPPTTMFALNRLANHSANIEISMGDNNVVHMAFRVGKDVNTLFFTQLSDQLQRVDFVNKEHNVEESVAEENSVAVETTSAQSETDVDLQATLNEFFSLLNDASKYLGVEEAQKLVRSKIGSIKKINADIRKKVYPKED